MRDTDFQSAVDVVASVLTLGAQAPAGQKPAAPATPPMVLSTPAFADGAVIPNRHTQVQQPERGISPQLVWTTAPAATQSFVVHMRDPEVARNRTTEDQVRPRARAARYPPISSWKVS